MSSINGYLFLNYNKKTKSMLSKKGVIYLNIPVSLYLMFLVFFR